MYNTDRVSGYDHLDGEVEFQEEIGFEIKGKEWARGYGEYRPRTVYNMGRRWGFGRKHPWDVRTFFSNLWDILTGIDTFSDYHEGRGYYVSDPQT